MGEETAVDSKRRNLLCSSTRGQKSSEGPRLFVAKVGEYVHQRLLVGGEETGNEIELGRRCNRPVYSDSANARAHVSSATLGRGALSRSIASLGRSKCLPIKSSHVQHDSVYIDAPSLKKQDDRSQHLHILTTKFGDWNKRLRKETQLQFH